LLERHAKVYQRAMEIERFPVPSRAEFEKNYVSARKPVILTGVASAWPACARWSLDYLRSTVGHKVLPVRIFPKDRDDNWVSSAQRLMPVSEFIDTLDRKDRPGNPYLEFRSLQQDLPELLGDVRLPSYFDEKRLFNLVLFLGRDSIAPTHYHPLEENFLCQVLGRKRVLLYPPEQTPCLYPLPWNTPDTPCFSRVAALNPDLEKFPRFKDARPIDVVIEPGEMLYIPLHWWHGVFGLGVNVTVSWFWMPRLAERRRWLTSSMGRRFLLNRLHKTVTGRMMAGVIRIKPAADFERD
jgi:hypothetical protein